MTVRERDYEDRARICRSAPGTTFGKHPLAPPALASTADVIATHSAICAPTRKTTNKKSGYHSSVGPYFLGKRSSPHLFLSLLVKKNGFVPVNSVRKTSNK